MLRRPAPTLRTALLGLVAVAAAALTATGTAGSAAAITHGGPDGGAHPSTGGLVAAQA